MSAKTLCIDVGNLDSSLNVAALIGDYNRVRSLLFQGAEVDKPEIDGKTPLIRAVEWSNFPIVNILLAYGANINVADDRGETALHKAFSSSDVHPLVVGNLVRVAKRQHRDTKELVKVLLKAGCNLAHAAYFDDYDVFKSLVNLGANVHATGFEGKTALHIAAESDQRILANYLFNLGASANALDDYGRSALCLAAAKGNSILVHWLLKRGANPNAKAYDYGLTPLIAAMENSREKGDEKYDECVELLLLYGSKPSQKIGDHPTVFDEALKNNAFHRIDLMIGYMAFREMQGESMAKKMINCKLEQNQFALPMFVEYYEACQQKLKTEILYGITLFDLLMMSDIDQFRCYIRLINIDDLLSYDGEICSEYRFYYVLLKQNVESLRLADLSRQLYLMPIVF